MLFFSCQEKKKENTKSSFKTEKIEEIKELENVEIKKVELEKQEIFFNTINIFPKDTIINSWNLSFKQISLYDFKSLRKSKFQRIFNKMRLVNF